MTIREMLDQPNSTELGTTLTEWVKSLPGRIVGGDMMLGLLSPEEIDLVPTALRKANDCGTADALILLAQWLSDPPCGDPDLDGAKAVYREAISAKSPGAELAFARFIWFHCRETATPQERREAFLIAQSSAESAGADGEPFHLLGLMTSGGFGTPADPVGAFGQQTKAADMGSAAAMFETFIYYETGTGVAKDSAKALVYLQRSAEKGHDRAMYNLAAFLATGRGLPKDPAEAVRWYTRASDAGNIRATANLAMMYATGEGVEKDLEYAKELFDEAEYMGLDVSDSRARVGV